MDEAPYTITILGGGTAGWLAAAVLARFLDPHRYHIRLIESDAIGTVGVGEATIPQIQLLNQALGIDEDAMVRATQATYKLGIEFAGWGDADSRYMHAFGPVGRPVGPVPFHHYWLRGRAAGALEPLDAYALNARAAYAGRFARGERAVNPAVGGMGHAYHFDAALYAIFLRRLAEARGVERVAGTVRDVARTDAGTRVAALHLDDGRIVDGDLFLDCSGFRAMLIGGMAGNAYDDWSHWLPCDRAVARGCRHAPDGPDLPYTRSTAHAAGWQWRIPLQHRIGNGHVYCSRHLSDDGALAQLNASLEGDPLGEPRLIRFTTGRWRAAWSGNVVALGLAAGFLEPLESTSIHLVQSAVERLIRFLPARVAARADIAAYNDLTAFEWMRVRDFLILHYHLNRRPEPLWRACAAMAVPDTLIDKLTLFAANGRIVRAHDELFAEDGWLQVMVGQGLIPSGHHPLADVPSSRELGELLNLIRTAIDRHVATMPGHAAFIAQHGRAAAGT